MAVPEFFKWLCIRYPKVFHEIIKDVPEPSETSDSSSSIPEIDNFYIDLDSIIHICANPGDSLIPSGTENEILNNVFTYLDKLMGIVKPKKIVYFAMDGVLPAAKINQARTRKYKTVHDVSKIIEKKEILKKQWQQCGETYPTELDAEFTRKFDLNLITAGTEFMHRLSNAIQYYITERMNNNPLLQGTNCIFCDSSVAGESKQKILEFIRQQRALEGYDPNTKHCLFGTEAELFTMGLATHEPHFYLLKEAVMSTKDIEGLRNREGFLSIEEPEKQQKVEGFQFLSLPVFREYLDIEFKYLNLPFYYDLERFVDDFVFMCFFVENDVLPHLPCFSLSEGGLDYILYVYKRILPFIGGHFVDNGELNLQRVEILLREIGHLEETIVRGKVRSQDLKRIKQRKGSVEEENPPIDLSLHNVKQERPAEENVKNASASKEKGPMLYGEKYATPERFAKWEKKAQERASYVYDDVLEDHFKYYERFQEGMSLARWTRNLDDDELIEEEPKPIPTLDKIPSKESKEAKQRFISELKTLISADHIHPRAEYFLPRAFGFKQGYYFNKFKIQAIDFPEFRKLIQKAYCEGLCWLFAYYYKGCISWEWLYPFHAAPFASDLVGIDRIPIKFVLGFQLKPLEFLLAVLPPENTNLVPLGLRSFMTDYSSELVDYYPIVHEKGEKSKDILLPFIDIVRLRHILRRDVLHLPQLEAKRNEIGKTVIFSRQESPLMTALKEQHPGFIVLGLDATAFLEYSQAGLEGKFAGMVQKYQPDKNHPKPSNWNSAAEIVRNQVAVLDFESPQYKPHKSQLKEGVVLPEPVLDLETYEKIDKKFYSENKAIKMIERALRIEYDLTSMNDKFNRGIVESSPQSQDFTYQQSYPYGGFDPSRQNPQQAFFPQMGYSPMGMPGNMPVNRYPGVINPGLQVQQVQQVQQPVVSFDLLNKRDRPQTRSPDDKYGDNLRKQQF